jgi:hypothetical protein
MSTSLSEGRSAFEDLRSWPVTRWAGVGALTFLSLVVLQNVLTAASQVPHDATAPQILQYAHDSAWKVQLLFVTYVIGFPALFAFVGGLSELVAKRAPRAALPSRIGQYCAVAVAVLFGLINVTQVTLVAAGGDLAGDPALVRTLWTLHNAIFTLNLVAVAGALFGLGRAAAISRIVPLWMGEVSLAGALALVASALPIVAEIHGSRLLALGLAGFLCWLLFLAVAGISLLRLPRSES